ncbi:RodZ domain-containing protein [Selenomonas sputigena]|uniref:helix-turn-helix domain-containing protein n=1 Tax=Selenomonas sputigena TaxID=69823 RepID=UPI0028E5646F|nr:RodZ domain-containing protein [Selenomonas sputigena]
MIGDLLRRERERQNLSIKDIEKATSIRALYIDAIEKGEYKTLPGEVYAKGFVRNYANYLKLNANEIVNAFNEEMHPQEELQDAAGSSSAEEARQEQSAERNREEYRGPKITSLESYPMEKSSHGVRNALMVAAAVFVVAFAALIAFGGDEEPSAPAPRAKTQTQQGQKQTEAAPKPAADSVEVKLSFTDRCWTEVVVDGKTEFEGTAEKGKVLTLKGKDKVRITAGNAGALNYSLNGKDMGAIGQKGEVVEKTFTKENAAK